MINGSDELRENMKVEYYYYYYYHQYHHHHHHRKHMSESLYCLNNKNINTTRKSYHHRLLDFCGVLCIDPEPDPDPLVPALPTTTLPPSNSALSGDAATCAVVRVKKVKSRT